MRHLPDQVGELLKFNPNSFSVTSRECKWREFKQQFDKKHFPSYTKTLAAFSNSDGGVLIYGISDKPRKIIGIEADKFPDEANWVDQLRRDFEPQIPFQIREYSISDRTIIVIGVYTHDQRPVICKRNATIATHKNGKQIDKVVLTEGAIYCRQSGQIRLISCVELKDLMNKQVERQIKLIFENVKIMQQIGLNRGGIVDLSKSEAPNDIRNLYVSPEVAKSLNFIEEGRFVENDKDGVAAYKLAGSIQLREVIVRPLDERDKNLPNEVAEMIKPLIIKKLGFESSFTGSHLAKLAKYLGIRKGDQTNSKYCIYEKKFRRVYYTLAGVEHIKKKLFQDFNSCLHAFASKATIEKWKNR